MNLRRGIERLVGGEGGVDRLQLLLQLEHCGFFNLLLEEVNQELLIAGTYADAEENAKLILIQYQARKALLMECVQSIKDMEKELTDG